MRPVFNRPELKKYRRQLRHDRTPAEHILWRYLRARRMLGYKFRRQHGIGGWIVDFYCPELRLVIEVDGDSHFEVRGQQADRRREEYFRRFEINTIHIRNDYILGDELMVAECIAKYIVSHPSYTSP